MIVLLRPLLSPLFSYNFFLVKNINFCFKKFFQLTLLVRWMRDDDLYYKNLISLTMTIKNKYIFLKKI